MEWIVAVLLCLAVGAGGWGIAVGRRLARFRADADQALRQLLLYRSQAPMCRDAAGAQRNREQIELSQTIYRGVAEAYNRCLQEPANRIPARLLGYHPMGEEEIYHAHRRL